MQNSESCLLLTSQLNKLRVTVDWFDVVMKTTTWIEILEVTKVDVNFPSGIKKVPNEFILFSLPIIYSVVLFTFIQTNVLLCALSQRWFVLVILLLCILTEHSAMLMVPSLDLLLLHFYIAHFISPSTFFDFYFPRWQALGWMHTHPHWGRLGQVSSCLWTRSNRSWPIWGFPAQRKDFECARGNAQAGTAGGSLWNLISLNWEF